MGKCEDKGKNLQEEGDGDDGGEKEGGGGRKEGDETAGEGRYKYLNKLDGSKCSSHRRSIGPASSRPPSSNLEETLRGTSTVRTFSLQRCSQCQRPPKHSRDVPRKAGNALVLTATMSMYRIPG